MHLPLTRGTVAAGRPVLAWPVLPGSRVERRA